MLAFETRWQLENIKPNAHLGKIIINVALGTFMQIGHSLGIFVLPCMPGFAGFWILDECRTQSSEFLLASDQNILNLFFKVSIAIFTFSGGCLLVSMTMFQVCLILVQGYSFATYTKGLIRTAQKYNQVNGCREATWATQEFREIQLMVAVYHRQLNSKSVFLGILIPGPFVQVLGNYTVIEYLRGRAHLPIEMIMHIGCIVIVTFCTFCLAIGFLAMVYRESKDVQKLLGRNARNKAFKRFCKSCPVLKVNFGGSGNFFEPVTSLNIEQFSIDQTINLLLADI